MKYILGGVVLLLVVAGAFYWLSATNAMVSEIPTRYETAELTVLSPMVSLNNESIEESVLVTNGDTVTTDQIGRALLRIGLQLITSIGEQSEVVFSANESLATTKYELRSGKLWSRLERSLEQDEVYEVYTPTLAAAVRGTSFGAYVEDELEKIVVTEGEVVVSPRDGSVPARVVVAGEVAEVLNGTVIIRPIEVDEQDAWYQEHTADNWPHGGSNELQIVTAHRDDAFLTAPGQVTVVGQGFHQVQRIVVNGELLPFALISDTEVRLPISKLLSLTPEANVQIYRSDGSTISPLEIFVGDYDEVSNNLLP